MFTKLVGGNRVANLLGYSEAKEKSDVLPYKFGDAYDFIELGVGDAYVANAQGEFEEVGDRGLLAGARLLLSPAGTFNPARGYHAVISVTKELARVGTVSYQSIISSGDNSRIGISVDVKEAFKLSDLSYLCRVYLAD